MTDVIEHRSAPPEAGPNAIREQVTSLLIAGESLQAIAVQHRLYALVHRRNVAAATSGRFIYMTRPILGGYNPVSVRWQDLREARLQVGMISATLALTYSGNLSDTAIGEGAPMILTVSGLEIPAAQALYRECQAQEQAWREKRRVRSIEEMRAQSGGVQVATGVYPQGAPTPAQPEPVLEHAAGGATAEDPTARLSRAREMLRQGLINDAEYEAIKARIVGGL